MAHGDASLLRFSFLELFFSLWALSFLLDLGVLGVLGGANPDTANPVAPKPPQRRPLDDVQHSTVNWNGIHQVAAGGGGLLARTFPPPV
jgi:hypothetical protein